MIKCLAEQNIITVYHVQSNWKGPCSTICSPIYGGIIASSEWTVNNGSLDFEHNSDATYENKTIHLQHPAAWNNSEKNRNLWFRSPKPYMVVSYQKVSCSYNASNFSQNKKNEAYKKRSVVPSDLIQHRYLHWSKNITANPPNKHWKLNTIFTLKCSNWNLLHLFQQ